MSEIKRNYEGSESPEKPIDYSSIQNQLIEDGILFKHGLMGGRPEMEMAVRSLGLGEELENKLLRMGSRDFDHCIRLIKHGGVEKIFAIAYIEYSRSVLPQDYSQARAITAMINSEGSDTQMFWTFAPYLFQALTEKGVVADKAVTMILNWSKDGISVSKAKWDDNFKYVHLKGLGFLNQHRKPTYILSGDANHPSHRFTAQEALRIADMLIAENEK